MTCGRRFPVSEGVVIDEHAGVLYADQTDLQVRPEDAAFDVDRIVSTLPTEAMEGGEFYPRAWMSVSSNGHRPLGEPAPCWMC